MGENCGEASLELILLTAAAISSMHPASMAILRTARSLVFCFSARLNFVVVFVCGSSFVSGSRHTAFLSRSAQCRASVVDFFSGEFHRHSRMPLTRALYLRWRSSLRAFRSIYFCKSGSILSSSSMCVQT